MWQDEFGKSQPAIFPTNGLEDPRNVNTRDRSYYALKLECRNVFYECLLCHEIHCRTSFVEHLARHIKDRAWVLRILKGEISDGLRHWLLNYCGHPVDLIPLGRIKKPKKLKSRPRESIQAHLKREDKAAEKNRFVDWKDKGGSAADYGGTRGLSYAQKHLRRSDLKAARMREHETPGLIEHWDQGRFMGESGKQREKVESFPGLDSDKEPLQKSIDFDFWSGDFSAATRNYSYLYAPEVWPKVLDRRNQISLDTVPGITAAEYRIQQLTIEFLEDKTNPRLQALLDGAHQDLDHILYQRNHNNFPEWMLPFVESVCRSVGIKRREDWVIAEYALTRKRKYGNLFTQAEISKKVRRLCRRKSYTKDAVSDRIDIIVSKLAVSSPIQLGGNRDIHQRMLKSLLARQHKKNEQYCRFCHSGEVKKFICGHCGVLQYIGKRIPLTGWDNANIRKTGLTWQWLDPDEHWRTWPDYQAALELRDRIQNIPIGLNPIFYKRLQAKTPLLTKSMSGLEPFFLSRLNEILRGNEP